MEYGLIFHVTCIGKYYCKNMKYRINVIVNPLYRGIIIDNRGRSPRERSGYHTIIPRLPWINYFISEFVNISMTSEFFWEEIMEFINGSTGIQPPTYCSILSSTHSATFLSTPSFSLPASTAATLSSTSSSCTVEPPTNSSTLSSTPFATFPDSTAAILPSTSSSSTAS